MKEKVATTAISVYSFTCICMSIYFEKKNQNFKNKDILKFWIV